MRRKRILVTGASGYIGRHVVAKLTKKGYPVTAVDLCFGTEDLEADCIPMDIFCGEKDIYQRLGNPDVCIHLAWRNGFMHNHESHILDLANHYMFLRNMIEAGLPHLAVMGSMHEVGYHEGAIDEDTPTNPSSLYGIAKNSLRQMMKALCASRNVTFQWLRGFYIIGDDLKNNSVFSKITQKALDGEETFPFTTGKNQYDFIDIEELANQIACASVQEEVQGEINCCSGNPVSLADKVEEFIRKHQYRIKLEYGAFPDRPYDSPGIWGDPSKINRIMERENRNV